MSGRPNVYQAAVSAVCVLLITGFFALLYQAGGFRWADQFLYDLYFKWRGPSAAASSNHVVLVLMDQKSAGELGREKSSWSRRHLARALNHLGGAGAEIIGLDLVFMAPDSDPEADRILASAMSRCGNVVLARGASAQGGELASLPVFQEAATGDGFIDFPLDGDEVLRRVRYLNARRRDDGRVELLPSFSLELVRAFLDLSFTFDFSGKADLVMGDTGHTLRLPQPELLVNYRGDHAFFPSMSFADAVNNRFPPDLVKGKIVLVGSSLATEKDVFTTPFTRFRNPPKEVADKFGDVVTGVLPAKDLGMACHAHAVETVLSGAFIRRAAEGRGLLLLMLTGLAAGLFYHPGIGVRWAALLLVLGLSGFPGTGYLLFASRRIWADMASPAAILACQFAAAMVVQKVFERKKTAYVTRLFGRYVSQSVVAELISGRIDPDLSGRREELTILFSDLRNFTRLSERLGARNTGLLLNEYFSRMIPTVFAHRGTLDKLMGDAVMAFFGAPLPVPDHPVQGAETALNMLETLKALKAECLVEGVKDLEVGVGVNTGEVTVGNLGSRDFMDYTIIGDAVNLASRLEGLNKVYGTSVILSEFTAARLEGRFLLRELDRVRVKGKETPVTLYELMGRTDAADETVMARIRRFADGLAAYRSRDWDEAAARFTEVLGECPGDGPSRLYLERIAEYRSLPADAPWDGVATFDHK